MTPHRCPVCNGAGTVYEYLYTRVASTNLVACRTCSGTGIVWGWAAVPYVAPLDSPWVLGPNTTQPPFTVTYSG